MKLSIRKIVVLIFILSLVFFSIHNIYIHTTIECPFSYGPHLWIDYGRIHIRIGNSSHVNGYSFNILYWPGQDWSFDMPGHKRPIWWINRNYDIPCWSVSPPDYGPADCLNLWKKP